VRIADEKEASVKITRATSRVLSIPTASPLIVGVDQPDTRREFVVLELNTDDGLTGIGVTFFGGAIWRALKAAVDALSELIIGEDPTRTEAIAATLRRAAGSSGPGGIFTLAHSAIDIACWDLKAKAANLPLALLLGGVRERAPTYASGAMPRDLGLPYLEKAGPNLIEMGFREMKMNCGSEMSISESVERVRIVREGIGPDIKLMCDINQMWSVNQAIDIGKRLEEFRLTWLEDPTAHDDFSGLARVADALTTPIATGEYHYGLVPFRHMLEQRSLDIVMIDVLRAGGITQWLKIAGMAEAFNVPVVSHLLPELHVHLITAIPNGLTVEYMPWSLALWEETPSVEDGQIVVPDRPGHGLQVSAETIRRYTVAA
jgi:L-alanine-DL-glutamate epimerase-like enolase superfamily enzyme